MAFENAKTKATDYAGFASRTLGRTISLIDGINNGAAPIPYVNYDTIALASVSKNAPTTIQVGNLDISYNLQATFALRW